MNLIVCVDKKNGIGKDNELLFHLPSDMEFFKKMTMEKVVVMGKNTFLSLPNGPLPNRENIVLSSSLERDDCMICRDKNELFNRLRMYSSEDVFVIGGEQIYRLLVDFCDKAYVTKVDAKKSASCFFPDLDSSSNWLESGRSQVYFENGYEFYFVEYDNKNVAALEDYNEL